jgi:hypothetical protein
VLRRAVGRADQGAHVFAALAPQGADLQESAR